jgi:hypothetical protein
MFENYGLNIIKHVKLLWYFAMSCCFLCWCYNFDLGMNNSGDDLCGSLFMPLYLSFVVELLLLFIKIFMLLTYLEPRFDLVCKVYKFFVARYA